MSRTIIVKYCIHCIQTRQSRQKVQTKQTLQFRRGPGRSVIDDSAGSLGWPIGAPRVLWDGQWANVSSPEPFVTCHWSSGWVAGHSPLVTGHCPFGMGWLWEHLSLASARARLTGGWKTLFRAVLVAAPFRAALWIQQHARPACGEPKPGFQQPAGVQPLEPAATCKFMKRGGIVLNFGMEPQGPSALSRLRTEGLRLGRSGSPRWSMSRSTNGVWGLAAGPSWGSKRWQFQHQSKARFRTYSGQNRCARGYR